MNSKYIKEINIKKKSKLNVSDEFLKALDDEVPKMVEKAEERAESNKRTTLLGRDL